MISKKVVYPIGYLLVILWLFVAITGESWILWFLVMLGIIVFGLMIFSVWHLSTSDPYRQYIERHNENAAALRAKMERDKLISESDQALIDTSDD